MAQAAAAKICGSSTRISVVLIDKLESQINHAKDRLDQFMRLELKELKCEEGGEHEMKEKKRKRVETKEEEEKVAESEKVAEVPNQRSGEMSEESFQQHDY